MAKRSVFRDFITALCKHWRAELPEVRPLGESLGPALPKASTFYAGVAQPLGLHVFGNFQHSPKAWEVGQFIVNVVLSRSEGAPPWPGGSLVPEAGRPFTEGRYRIGPLLGRRSSPRRGGRRTTPTRRRFFPRPSPT
jgi:hypothetical protein